MPSKASWSLKIATAGVLLFLHFPVALIILYSLTTEQSTFSFPPPGLTLDWYEVAADRTDMWDAFERSVQVAAVATLMAMILGTLAALAMYRASFFGKDTVSLLIILPIALPGIITAMALRSAFALRGIELSFWTIVVGHATFCIVTVYNNVIARLRRTAHSQIEASMDLGASPLQTFRHVILPHMGTALLAGAMLAFALSFDEVVVTNFTSAPGENTLPIWIFQQIPRPRDRPVTNVAAVLVIAVTTLPILGAYYLTREATEQ